MNPTITPVNLYDTVCNLLSLPERSQNESCFKQMCFINGTNYVVMEATVPVCCTHQAFSGEATQELTQVHGMKRCV